MIPMRCFTCGRPMAHQWDVYQEREAKLRTEKKDNPAFKVLASLHVGRACCRRMFLCQQDMYHKTT